MIRMLPWRMGTGQAILFVCLAGSAQGQVTFEILDPLVAAPRGSVVLVSGIIQNDTTGTLYVNDLSVSAPEGFVTENVLDIWAAMAPETLLAGEGWEGPLATLTIAGDAPLQTAICGLSLTGGAHAYDVADLGTVYFLVDDSTTVLGADPGAPPVPGGALTAAPNPFRSTTSIRLSLARGEEVDVNVYDVSGGLVRRLAQGTLPAGSHELLWDGRNDSGNPVGNGFYFIRARSSGGLRTTKVVRIE
jgi:hypothetical protein